VTRAAAMRHFVRFGTRRSVARAAYGVMHRAAGVRIVDCFRLDRRDLRSVRLSAAFEPRWLTPGEVMAVAGDPRLVLDWPWRALALERGDACLGLFDGDRLASFSWYAVEPTPILGDRRLRFPADRVYTYHGLTLPEYRGRRLYAAGRSLALKHYAARGYQGLVTCIERINYASKRSSRVLGFVPCGSLYRVAFAGRNRAWASARALAEGLALEDVA